MKNGAAALDEYNCAGATLKLECFDSSKWNAVDISRACCAKVAEATKIAQAESKIFF